MATELDSLKPNPEDVSLSELTVEKLSGLPLAIVQVASAIQRRQLSFAEFLEFYLEETFRRDIYLSQNNLERPIWTVFAFGDLSSKALAMLHIHCFPNPDSIPESIFGVPLGKPRDFSSGLEGFPRDKIELMNARTELAGSSLIKRNIEMKEIIVHRVVQASALANMDSERQISAFRVSLNMLIQA